VGRCNLPTQVLAALLARDIEVREHFDAIMWITLSQTPDIGRQLQLLHLQASGRELTPGKTPEEVRQLVMDAVKSRNVLLILDDVRASFDCSTPESGDFSVFEPN
jgi:hypothetical protein